MTIRSLLQQASQKLADSDSPKRDAEILLCHALEVKRSFLYANPELELPLRRRQEFTALLKQRLQGQPIAYITGTRPFWSLDLQVSEDVLIPRAETELLIETALALFPASPSIRAADLGTGSGAIALAVAKERPCWEVHATELCPKALEVARRNAINNGLDRVQFYLGNWLEPLKDQYSLLISNPPYIAHDDPHLLTGDCRFEPQQALTPGGDGLGALREIAMNAAQYLLENGWLILEHGYNQGNDVREMLENQGYKGVYSLPDLAGIERVTCGSR